MYRKPGLWDVVFSEHFTLFDSSVIIGYLYLVLQGTTELQCLCSFVGLCIRVVPFGSIPVLVLRVSHLLTCSHAYMLIASLWHGKYEHMDIYMSYTTPTSSTVKTQNRTGKTDCTGTGKD
jgi:hypothetical protein